MAFSGIILNGPAAAKSRQYVYLRFLADQFGSQSSGSDTLLAAAESGQDPVKKLDSFRPERSWGIGVFLLSYFLRFKRLSGELIRNQSRMAKKHFKLQHSESVIVQAAAQIYAAYIASGRVAEGDEASWMKRSIKEAVMIGQATDDTIISDAEIDATEAEDSGAISVGRIRTEGNRLGE